MTRFTESTVELAALDWLAQVGYAVMHGGDIAPGEAAAEIEQRTGPIERVE